MEINVEFYSEKFDDFDIGDFVPLQWSKQVVKDCSRLASSLPMMQNHDNFEPVNQRRYLIQDHSMQEYLRPILVEIAEIRDEIKEIAPHLRKSQQILQKRIFSFARNHTTLSRRLRSLRAKEYELEEKGNGLDSASFPKRWWYHILSFLIKVITPKWLTREKEQRRVQDAFHNFYQVNGSDFKMYLLQAMVRCKKLEVILSSLKHQMGAAENHNTQDNIAGIAGQIRVSKDEMQRWKKDIEYVWKEVKNLKTVFCLLPVHNCWQAIFNIMTGQSSLNVYV